MAVSDLNIRIGVAFSDFDKSMRQVERRLQQSAQRFQNIGNALSASITLPVIGLGAAAVNAAGDFEQLQNSLNTVMKGAGYSIQQTTQELEKLQKISLAPGIDMEQAVKGSIRLQSVGFSAERARNTLVELANALATSGGSAQQLDGVTRQFAQMSAKGKIMQEDLTIILENMPSLAKVLMDTFGTTNAEAIRNMGVSADQFISKIVDGLSKTERAQGGIKNAITNAETALKQFFSIIGNEINKAYNLNSVADSISDTLRRAAEAFRNLSPEVKKGIVSFALYAAAIGPAIKAIQGLYSAGALAVSGVRIIADALKGSISSISNAVIWFNKLSTAMKFTYAGAIIAGIMAVSAAYSYLSQNVNSAFHVTERLNEVQKQANEYAADGIGRAEGLMSAIKNENATQEQRLSAYQQLIELYPKYYAHLDKEKIDVIGATQAYENLKASIMRASMARAASESLDKVALKRLELEQKKNDLIAYYNKQLSTTAQNQLFNNAVTQAGRDEVEKTFAAKRKGFADELAAIDKAIAANQREIDALANVKIANTDLEPVIQKTAAATSTAATATDKSVSKDKAKAKSTKEVSDSMQELLDTLDQLDAANEQRAKAEAAGSPGGALSALPGVNFSAVQSQTDPAKNAILMLGLAAEESQIKIDGLGQSFVNNLAQMGVSSQGMSAIAAGMQTLGTTSQDAFQGVADSLAGVEGAYANAGVAALIAASQMIKAALAATLAKAIQDSMTKSGHPLAGLVVAGIAVAGVNALFGKINQSLSKEIGRAHV